MFRLTVLSILTISTLCIFTFAANGKVKPQKEEVAEITTNFGKIVFRFFPEIAPNHVKNFKELAEKKFYDGCRFHRVIPGFMIQGGDPNSKLSDRSKHGMGDSGKRIAAEFTDKKHHKRGIVSMARAADPNSASCQFFIMVAKSPQLDGKYSIFGEVIEGMDVVDKIVNLKRDRRDNPISDEDARIISIRIKKTEVQ